MQKNCPRFLDLEISTKKNESIFFRIAKIPYIRRNGPVFRLIVSGEIILSHDTKEVLIEFIFGQTVEGLYFGER